MFRIRWATQTAVIVVNEILAAYIPHGKVQFDSGRTCTQFLGLHYRSRSRRCLLNRQIEDISLFSRL